MSEKSVDEMMYESVEQLSKAKNQAESRIRMARALHKEEELSTAELNRIYALYDDARTEVNAILDRLLIELENTREVEDPESFDLAAERTRQQVAAFLDQSDSILLGDTRGVAVLGEVLGVAGEFVSSIVEIWKTLRGEKNERRALAIARIDQMKWQNYNEI